MEQSVRSDRTRMPARQDARPSPEADARRDAAATALLSAPRAPASGPSPALATMVAEWQDLLAQINDESVTDGQAEPLGQRHNELQLAICGFPAASVADLLAKVPVFEDQMRDAVGGLAGDVEPKDTLPGAAWLGLFRDFERLAHAPAPLAAAEVSLAHMVVDYFGSEDIDPRLNCDIALRDRARAILAAQGSTEEHDWDAWAAHHPGFMPIPANKPVCLAPLARAIPEEARRLLNLARVEFARREAAYVGFHNPAVWPRVATQLRREMRMDLLERVAADLPGGCDPAASDTALLQAIETHDAAHKAFATKIRAADSIAVAEAGGDASDEAMAPAEAARDAANEVALQAWRDLFERRPGSLDGLLALLRHVEEHYAGHVGIAEEPDVFGYLVESAEALARVGAPPSRTARPVPEADPAASALVDAIESGWAEWSIGSDRDYQDVSPASVERHEALCKRRDDLLDAADALPATSRASRHAKALVAAWGEYVAVWELGKPYTEYGTFDRLVLDIDAALKAGARA